MNTLITPEQMARDVLALMIKHGLVTAINEATPEHREEIIRELMNTFGANMPPLPQSSRE